LRRQRRVVADRGRQRAAIHRERAGEDKPRPRAQRAAGIEHGPGAVQIDPVPEIGVGLGLAADDRGEMKNRIGAGRDQPLHRFTVGNVAGDEPDPPIVGQRQCRGRVVEQHQFLDRPKRAAVAEQLQRDPPPEKPAPSGDHDPHVLCPIVCWMADCVLRGLALRGTSG